MSALLSLQMKLSVTAARNAAGPHPTLAIQFDVLQESLDRIVVEVWRSTSLPVTLPLVVQLVRVPRVVIGLVMPSTEPFGQVGLLTPLDLTKSHRHFNCLASANRCSRCSISSALSMPGGQKS